MSEHDGGTEPETGGTSGTDFVDPSELIFNEDNGSGGGTTPGGRKRRSDAGKPRGPRGTSSTKAKSASQIDLSAYVGIWAGLHAQLAIMSGEPSFAISEAEAKAFLGAAQNVMRHYSIQSTQKTMDWCAFAFVAGAIYAPRIAKVASRRNKPQQSQQAPMQAPNGWTIGPEMVAN